MTECTYDIGDPGAYGRDNNRLMFYTVTDVSGGGNVLLSTTWYYYDRPEHPNYPKWGNPMLRFICSTVTTDTRQPFVGDPRSIARRAVDYMPSCGVGGEAMMAP